MSRLFTLGFRDLFNGFVVAVLGAVFASLAQLASLPGFDYTSFEWTQVINTAVVAAVAYLAKNFGSTSQGDFAGIKTEKK